MHLFNRSAVPGSTSFEATEITSKHIPVGFGVVDWAEAVTTDTPNIAIVAIMVFTVSPGALPFQIVLCYKRSMPSKSPPKPKLTDADRHKRFVDMAKEVGASDKPIDFDKAFQAVAQKGKAP